MISTPSVRRLCIFLFHHIPPSSLPSACVLMASPSSILPGSGWGPSDYPQVVGHEIVGHVVRVGSKAEGDLKIGDLVGVGAQNDSVRISLNFLSPSSTRYD